MPGRLFKGIDIKQTYNAPLYNVYKEGDIHGFISSKLAHEGEQRLKNTYMSIGKRMYQVSDSGDMKSLVDITDQIGDFSVISMDHGCLPRMYKNMIGTDRTVAAEENKLLSLFDLNQTGQPTIWSRMKAYTGKFKNEDWGRNRLTAIIDQMNDAEENNPLLKQLMYTDDEKLEVYKNIKALDKTLDAYTASNKITDDTLANLLYATNEEGERLLSKKSQAMLRGIIKGDIGEAVFSDEAFEETLTESKDVISMLRVLSSDTATDGNIQSLRNHDFENPRLKSLIISRRITSSIKLTSVETKSATKGILDCLEDMFNKSKLDSVLLVSFSIKDFSLGFSKS